MKDLTNDLLFCVFRYLPSGLLGEVRNMHLGFSSSTTSAMRSTFKVKSLFLGTVKAKQRPNMS